jgi:hypothetical protein
MSLDEAAFKAWLDDYGRVWEQRDHSLIPNMYAEDARYYETPFDEPLAGLEQIAGYAGEASGAQKDNRFWYEVLGVFGNTGIARWGASFTRVPSGVKVKLDGIFQITMDANNKCRELREWWHRAES